MNAEEPDGLVLALGELSSAQLAQEKHNAAFETLERQVNILRQQPDVDKSLLALTLCLFADVAQQIERPEKAQKAVTEGVALAQAKSLDDETKELVFRTGLKLSQASGEERRTEFFRQQIQRLELGTQSARSKSPNTKENDQDAK